MNVIVSQPISNLVNYIHPNSSKDIKRISKDFVSFYQSVRCIFIANSKGSKGGKSCSNIRPLIRNAVCSQFDIFPFPCQICLQTAPKFHKILLKEISENYHPL